MVGALLIIFGAAATAVGALFSIAEELDFVDNVLDLSKGIFGGIIKYLKAKHKEKKFYEKLEKEYNRLIDASGLAEVPAFFGALKEEDCLKGERGNLKFLKEISTVIINSLAYIENVDCAELCGGLEVYNNISDERVKQAILKVMDGFRKKLIELYYGSLPYEQKKLLAMIGNMLRAQNQGLATLLFDKLSKLITTKRKLDANDVEALAELDIARAVAQNRVMGISDIKTKEVEWVILKCPECGSIDIEEQADGKLRCICGTVLAPENRITLEDYRSLAIESEKAIIAAIGTEFKGAVEKLEASGQKMTKEIKDEIRRDIVEAIDSAARGNDLLWADISGLGKRLEVAIDGLKSGIQDFINKVNALGTTVKQSSAVTVMLINDSLNKAKNQIIAEIKMQGRKLDDIGDDTAYIKKIVTLLALKNPKIKDMLDVLEKNDPKAFDAVVCVLEKGVTENFKTELERKIKHICPLCHHANKEGTSACEVCGGSLDTEATVARAWREKHKICEGRGSMEISDHLLIGGYCNKTTLDLKELYRRLSRDDTEYQLYQLETLVIPKSIKRLEGQLKLLEYVKKVFIEDRDVDDKLCVENQVFEDCEKIYFIGKNTKNITSDKN
jgi:hypothetical protein